MRYVVLEKKVGETPLEVLTAWKQTHAEYASTPASYAGRLDPMASGKLLVLLGDECKKQERYTGLDKEYEVEVLLAVGSDTGDVLGLVSYEGKDTKVSLHDLQQVLSQERGTHEREYPIFSSKTAQGKPLFLYALEGKLNNISIPTHAEHVYNAQVLSLSQVSTAELQSRVRGMLACAPKSDEPSKVFGADFRIREVERSWEKVFEDAELSFVVVKIRVTSGTGAYMRSLASRVGKALGTQALALSIHRTVIGRYWGGIWWKRY